MVGDVIQFCWEETILISQSPNWLLSQSQLMYLFLLPMAGLLVVLAQSMEFSGQFCIYATLDNQN